MVGLLGVLAAGAAQGYGTAKNREVDLHNQATIENNREMLRQQFENQRFERNLEAGMQQAKMKAEHDAAVYQRNRSDKLHDDDSQRKFELEKMGVQHNNARSLEGMREAGRNRRALLRRDTTATGGESGNVKAQSTMGKAIQDMMNMGLAENPQEAQLKLERSGVLKEMLKNPMYANDPNRLAQALTQWERNMGVQSNQQQAVADFIFNPQTGRLESAR